MKEASAACYLIGDCVEKGKYHLLTDYGKVAGYVCGERYITVSDNPDYFGPGALIASTFRPSESLVLSDTEVRFGNDSLPLSLFGYYHSGPLLSRIVPAAVAVNILKIENFTTRFSPLSLGFLIQGNDIADNGQGWERMFARLAREALEKLQLGDIAGCVSRMKGLGPGLTPAGDDFNAGLLTGIWLNGACSGRDTSGLRDLLLPVAKGNNLLSNAQLSHCAAGKFNPSVLSLIYALADPGATELENALTAVLAYGSTSGADFITGLFFAVRLNTGL